MLGGDRVGTRIVWGTGGDSGNSVEGIRSMTNNPDSFNILKYRHNYTPSGEYIETAMFIPAHRIVDHLLDSRGWCDPEEAMNWYKKQRDLKADDPKLLIMYKAEYCFTIDEALSNQGDNMFPREELANQLVRIDIYKEVPTPERGFLTWEIDRSTGNRTGKVSWRSSPEGNILITEKPMISENDLAYKNLYVGGIDSIDIGTADSANTRTGKKGGETRVSDFCILIKKRVFGQSDPYYVAMYKDRPKDPREAYENAAKLLVWYNAKANLEASRTAILTYFRDKKYTNLLMKRPRATMPDVSKGNSNMFGSPATVKVINHYRELIYDFCLDYSHTIAFREMLEQLLDYSDEDKKKFDIVAAMGYAELGDEELSARRPEEVEHVKKEFRNVGWFTDSKGYKHYGKIPLTEEERYAETRPGRTDSWLHKELI